MYAHPFPTARSRIETKARSTLDKGKLMTFPERSRLLKPKAHCNCTRFYKIALFSWLSPRQRSCGIDGNWISRREKSARIVWDSSSAVTLNFILRLIDVTAIDLKWRCTFIRASEVLERSRFPRPALALLLYPEQCRSR